MSVICPTIRPRAADAGTAARVPARPRPSPVLPAAAWRRAGRGVLQPQLGREQGQGGLAHPRLRRPFLVAAAVRLVRRQGERRTELMPQHPQHPAAAPRPRAGTRRFADRTLVDFVVVGSGAAGGVIAKELSTRGFTVVVLEQGPRVEPEQYEHDEFGYYFQGKYQSTVPQSFK